MSPIRRYLAGVSGVESFDQLDAVVVGIANETEPRAAFAHAVRLAFGLDPCATGGDTVSRKDLFGIPAGSVKNPASLRAAHLR